MKRTGVIVTDGNERSTLAVTRSLGQRGIPVHVGAETARSLAGASRFCTGSFVYPSPWREPEAYIACLLAAMARTDAAVLFPMTDIAMELTGEHRLEFERLAALPTPALDLYHRVSDKCCLIAWAEQAGIPTPRSIQVPDGDVDRIIHQIDAWPVIVKPGRSLLKVDGHWRKTAVLVARDPFELRRLYHEHWFLALPSMIQEHITGHGEGVFGLFADGQPIDLFAHRRLREFPPSGGVSVLREAIALPDMMTRYAVRIMQDATWSGVAMVEFRVDRQSRVPYLMEVNGRFWGSLQLAVDAGVDFPWQLYRSAIGFAEPRQGEPYRTGVRSRWWLGELDHLLLRMKERKWAIAPPPDSPPRRRILLGLINPFDGRTSNETLRWSDPRPGLLELMRYARSKLVEHGRRLGRRVHDKRTTLARSIADARLTRSVQRQTLPPHVESVLVLCKGNICRSPFAETRLRDAARRQGLDLDISSAGLTAITDAPAHPAATAAALEFDIDLSGHRTSGVLPALVESADVILVMEPGQLRALRQRFPGAKDKTFLLGHFRVGRPMAEITDPYGGTAEDFDECFATLAAACDGFVARL